MNFAFSEEQEQLRQFVRQFLEEKSPEAEVRRLMATDDGYDPEVWSQMADQMGLQSLTIPEAYGGQGYGYVELIVVLEEMGRSLLCAPFFSTVALAVNAILESGDDAAKAALLPGIATGETIATVAFTEANGRWDAEGVKATATPAGDGYTITGDVRGLEYWDGHLVGSFTVTQIPEPTAGAMLGLSAVLFFGRGRRRKGLPT